jgi:lipopolysaccharide transport system ATP-binding protein
MPPIIQSNNISKIYRIGAREQINRTFREALVDAIKSPYKNLRDLRKLTKFDPEEQESAVSPSKQPEDVIWALKDVSFQVEQGEVLGIIGRNGAGKSTLLKILSRITEPTSGEIWLHGRVSSLLEVGTGFHPELSGRENIYLNGTILGMRKYEIDKKFDEIVDFSGDEVKKLLDTPVKKYSSGMYVRLAFAVAAHLESEILIVDEVLAVGDAAFQKKCLGKMQDISAQEGRTILFVSHNMPAVRKFCHRGILLESGGIVLDGEVNTVVNYYLESGSSTTVSRTWNTKDRPGNQALRIIAVQLIDKNGQESSAMNISEDIQVKIQYEVIRNGSIPQFSVILLDMEGNCVFGSLNNKDNNAYGSPVDKGIYQSTCSIQGNLLNAGRFFISIAGFSDNWSDGFREDNVLSFDAIDDGILKGDYHGDYGGPIRPLLKWHTEILDKQHG